MASPYARLSAASFIAFAVACAALSMGTAAAQDENWVLFYSEDWSQGSGGWSTSQSYLPGKRTPRRYFVGNELASYILWFNGQCGWGLRSGASVGAPMKIVTRVLMQGSDRNALSVNLRTRGGTMAYKYSMGSHNRVTANKQPPGDDAVETAIPYALNIPYDLYSIYVPRSGYYLGLKNLLTGEDNFLPRRWSLAGSGEPGTIDIDQEGGHGPAALGRVEVYFLE